MKLSAKIAALKKRKQAKPVVRRPKAGVFTPWFWAWLALALAVAGAGTLAVYEFFIWNKVPPALVGKWQVEEGAQVGGTFEFYRNGNLIIQLKNQKQDYPPIKGLCGGGCKTLLTTMPNPLTLGEQSQTIAIRQLTAKSLILEFENGDVLKMVR